MFSWSAPPTTRSFHSNTPSPSSPPSQTTSPGASLSSSPTEDTISPSTNTLPPGFHTSSHHLHPTLPLDSPPPRTICLSYVPIVHPCGSDCLECRGDAVLRVAGDWVVEFGSLSVAVFAP